MDHNGDANSLNMMASSEFGESRYPQYDSRRSRQLPLAPEEEQVRHRENFLDMYCVLCHSKSLTIYPTGSNIRPSYLTIYLPESIT